MRRVLAAAAAVVALLAASGCSGLQGTEGKEYVSGDGRVQTFSPSEREAPVDSAGTTIDGEPIDIADYRGQVVVVTVWASWCGPCRKEMPMFAKLADSLPEGATVVGINTREKSAVDAAALVRTSGVTFPSLDDDGGRVLLDFSDDLGGPDAIPSTMVLDRQGRLARLILGAAPTLTTMGDVVDDVLAEPTGATSDRPADGPADE